MAELPDKSPGEIIDSAHINDIADRTIQRYVDAAERDSKNPTPVQGELAFIESTDEVQVFNGATWIMGGGGQLVGYLHGANGVATAPMYSFSGYPSAGMYYTPGAGVRISNLGAFQAEFADGQVRAGPGTAAAPSLSFQAENNTGMYRYGTGAIGFSAGGTVILRVAATSMFVEPVATDVRFRGVDAFPTTGSATNAHMLAGSGRFYVSTSARKYKSDIESADSLADLVLEPVTFHHNGDDRDHIGFIADDIPDVRAIEYDADGEVQSYNLQAVAAILAAKVNALEARLAALEA